jgi:NAD+ diphosphatase
LNRNHFLQVSELLETDRFVLFHHSEIVVKREKFVWDYRELVLEEMSDAEFILLERDADYDLIAVKISSDPSSSLLSESKNLWSILFVDSEDPFSVAGKARQLLDWYADHRFCGACGTKTVHHGSERALVCEPCNKHYFPRINPCAIMLVHKGPQMLLAKSSRVKTGFYSCLAGFVEIGETPEQTVKREVMEEVGLEVENIRYFKSQSWPFPSQLMLGFFAEYKSGEITPDPSEIEDAAWFDINNPPKMPGAGVSIAGELIRHFIENVKKESFE